MCALRRLTNEHLHLCGLIRLRWAHFGWRRTPPPPPYSLGWKKPRQMNICICAVWSDFAGRILDEEGPSHSSGWKRRVCQPAQCRAIGVFKDTHHKVNTSSHYGLYVTKTRLYNFDPLKPHFYTVKLGFTGVYIIFLISAQNIDCGYSLEPPRWGGSNKYPQSMFWAEIWKIS